MVQSNAATTTTNIVGISPSSSWTYHQSKHNDNDGNGDGNGNKEEEEEEEDLAVGSTFSCSTDLSVTRDEPPIVVAATVASAVDDCTSSSVWPEQNQAPPTCHASKSTKKASVTTTTTMTFRQRRCRCQERWIIVATIIVAGVLFSFAMVMILSSSKNDDDDKNRQSTTAAADNINANNNKDMNNNNNNNTTQAAPLATFVPTSSPVPATPPPRTTIPVIQPQPVPTLRTEHPTFVSTGAPLTAEPSILIITTHAPTTILPTPNPSLPPPPTIEPTMISFDPGRLTVRENGLLLSQGLTSKLLAISGQRVVYENGMGRSAEPFHVLPDYAACFADPDNDNNDGGWIYVINSEHRSYRRGGVAAFTFNAQGQLIQYQSLLTDTTTANCGGGTTPWGAFISCEEYENGQAWQVDPTGRRTPQVITLGRDGGNFESFAYDVRNAQEPSFFLTEDAQRGALQRFRVPSPNWKDPWTILLGSGITDYLILNPNNNNSNSNRGTFEWTTNKSRAQQSAQRHYPNAEGIDVHEGQLYFVSKTRSAMYTLDLDSLTYTMESTQRGLFNGGPDQIKRILNNNDNGSGPSSHLLFFTEDGGNRAGVHARNEDGTYLTILESPEYENETTGLSFSPDGKRMYVAYQNDGLLFEIRRTDGLPFSGRSLNVAYHAQTEAEG